MGAIVTNIVDIMTQGITGIASGIGGGLSALVQDIFVSNTGTAEAPVYELSLFGGVIVVFAGISLAIGLSKWVVNWVTSLGASH